MKQFLKTIFLIVIGTLIGYLLVKYVAPLVAPFIVAVFLAFFIEPFVGFLQKKARFPRAAAVGVAMISLLGGLGLLVALAVTRLIVELVHLSQYLPKYISNVQHVLGSMQQRAENYYFNLPADVLEFVNQRLAGSSYSLGAIVQKAQIVTGKILNVLLQLFYAVPVWVILIVISAIATYFMSKDKKVILMFWLRVLPAPWGKKSLEITKEIFQAIINYVRAQLILISITFLQTIAGLYIIDAPYVLVMSLVIGIADLIPILGPSSIYIPWVIWEFISGNTGFAIKLIILYGIVIVVRQVLETKIVSTTMGLHPLATLMAMYVGLKLLGGTGVIAGPLFLITVKAFATAGVIGLKRDRHL